MRKGFLDYKPFFIRILLRNGNFLAYNPDSFFFFNCTCNEYFSLAYLYYIIVEVLNIQHFYCIFRVLCSFVLKAESISH